MHNGQIHRKLRAVRVDRLWRLREGLPRDKQQRQEGIRDQGDPDKQIQVEQEALVMHGQLDQHPHQHLEPPQHNQILRHAQDLQQLLLHLLVLQRRHSRKSTLQTDKINGTACVTHLQAIAGGISGA